MEIKKSTTFISIYFVGESIAMRRGYTQIYVCMNSNHNFARVLVHMVTPYAKVLNDTRRITLVASPERGDRTTR